MHSGEANWWHAWQEIDAAQLDFVLGLRFVNYREKASASDWATDFGAGADPFVASDVDNIFVGGQAGLGATYRAGRRVELVGAVKGLFGVMMHDIEVRDQSFFSGGAHTGSIEKDGFSLGLDVDVALRYRFGERFAFTVGYNLLVLDDIVRAHDAMDFSRGATGAVQPIRRMDELVVHSILFGVVFDF
jgi:hypothetical protein